MTTLLERLTNEALESSCMHDTITLSMREYPVFGFVKPNGEVFPITLTKMGATYLAQKLEYAISAPAYKEHWQTALESSYGDFSTFEQLLIAQKSLLALAPNLQEAFDNQDLMALDKQWVKFVDRKKLFASLDDPALVCSLVNNALATMLEFVPKLKNAVYTAITHEGALFGLPRYYTAYPHAEVLQMVAKAGLESRITSGNFTPVLGQIFMQSEVIFGNNDYAWGVIVENGETGHYRLAYRFYLRFRDQILTKKSRAQTGKVRHESNLESFVEGLTELIDHMAEYEISLILETKKTSEFSAITNEFDKLAEEIAQAQESPIGQFIIDLLDITEHGKKTQAQKLAQKIVDNIL